MAPPPRPIAERFAAHVERTPTCWLWRGAKNAGGYGLAWIGRHRRALAHRVAWELAVGPIPTGLLVMHHCDTPSCVRVDHLCLGTNAENLADASRKGRLQYGAASRDPKASDMPIREVHCLRCGRPWWPRSPTKPTRCPHCGSPYWDRPRRPRKDGSS